MNTRDENFDPYVCERLSAANNGNAKAQYDLGLLFATGQGVSQNLVEAHKWFNLAALSGMQRAQVDCSEVARDMSKRDLQLALRSAREWQTKH